MRFRRAGIVLGITLILASCVQDTPSVVEPTTSADQGAVGAAPDDDLAPLVLAGGDSGLPDEYIVKLREQVVAKDEVRGIALAILGSGDSLNLHRAWGTFRGFHAMIAEDEVDKVRSHPAVEYVEQNQLILPDDVAPDMTLSTSLPPVPDSGTQSSPPWHLDRIDQADYPLDDEFSYSYSGDDVTIYVIDSGIRTTHDDFDGRASHVYQANDDWEPAGTDCLGHGTAVASAAGGSEWGVAKDANLAAVRIDDCERGATTADIVDGMDWVAENRDLPAVANLSYGASGSAISDAAEDLIEAGVVFGTSAGNDNDDACSVGTHSVASVLVVGALSNQSPDQRWADSNYGSCVDLYVPGHDIEIADITDDQATRTTSGTSLAAPQVAGAAAMYLERYPNDPPSTVHEVLKWGATPTPVTNGDPDRVLHIDQPQMHGVSVDGPTVISASDHTCEWSATPVGGRPSYSYTWSGVLSGSGATVSGPVGSGGLLTVQVEDSSGLSATVGVTIVVSTEIDPVCGF